MSKFKILWKFLFRISETKTIEEEEKKEKWETLW